MPSRKFFTFFYATMGIIEAVLVTEFVFTLSAYWFSTNTPFIGSPAFGDALKIEIVGIVLLGLILFVVEMIRRVVDGMVSGQTQSHPVPPPPPSV